MVSRQRERIKEVLEGASSPLPPRAIAEGANLPSEGTRKLLWKMAQDGQVVSLKGKYALPGYEPDQSAPVDGVDGPVDAEDDGDPLRRNHGIRVYNHQTGGSMPWRNKTLDGPYPPA